MPDNIAEIRKLFAGAGVELFRDEVWNVQGANVVKHKALERLSAALKIKWTEPKILRAEQDEAVILVLGSIGDHVEWSIGEARVVPMIDGGRRNDKNKVIWDPTPGAIGNYQVTPKQSAYVWAMAEKRGKDRVIIKLAGIDAYSEEESDDFKGRNSAPDEQSSDELYMRHALDKIAAMTDRAELDAWYQTETDNRQRMLEAPQIATLFKAMKARRPELSATTERDA